MDISNSTLNNLSGQSWTNSTTGAIIEYPWTSNSSRNVSGCVVDAQWAKGKVFYQYTTAIQPAINSMMHRTTDDNFHNDMFRVKPDNQWRRIRISEDLFDAVMFPGAFAIPSNFQTYNATETKSLIESFNWNQEWISEPGLPRTEQMIAAVFADALARAGSWRTAEAKVTRRPNWVMAILTGDGAFDESFGSLNSHTAIRMNQEVTGYAFKLNSVTDYMALVVVFAHLVIATGHTILMLKTRRSSACWDSFPELLALAMQSLPSPKALKNTATGIFTTRVFGQNTRIRVSTNDSEHVELALDADDRTKTLLPPDDRMEYG
ncbi:hypothetical protein N0V90_003931 [Kalmusia sp. IMI 367209]|nr:hypothetical protein N0V90_003931 [Kalmusia sp. IMI 367209]